MLVLVLLFGVVANALRPIYRGVSVGRTVFHAQSDSAGVKDYSKLPRVFVPGTKLELTSEVQLDARSSHYLTTVLRRKAGAQVRLFNARDGEFLCRLQPLPSQSRRALVTLQPEELLRQLHVDSPGDGHGKRTRDPAAQRPPPLLTLYFAPIKRARLKLLLEKASEVGVSRLVPVITHNTQSAMMVPAAAMSQLVESAEQCDRLDVATLIMGNGGGDGDDNGGAASLADVLDGWACDGELLLVCRERAFDAPPILRVAREVLGYSAAGSSSPRPWQQRVSVLVGPEGGFTADELSQLGRRSFVRFVSLGSNVLRTETAAVLALGCLAATAEDVDRAP